MKVAINIILTICTVTLINQIAIAAVYKWTDAAGTIHYTDNKDGHSQATEVTDIIPHATSGVQHDSGQIVAPASGQEAAPIPKQPDHQVLTQQKRQVKAACEKYRENLQLLQNQARRLYTIDQQGQYHYMTVEDRQKQLALTEEKIAAFCSKSR